MTERIAGPLLLVSRSMPPDIGGYQRQFLRLAPRLGEHFDEVVWIGSVRDSGGRFRLDEDSRVRSISLPASWMPRRVRGVADLAVAAVAFAWIVWTALLRRRRGAVLLLSPTMVGGASVLRAARAVDWPGTVRFPSRGDQLDARGRRAGRLASGARIAPSAGQLGEQDEFTVVAVPNAIELPADSSRGGDAAEGIFLFVGRLVRGKRPDLVLDAWRRLHAELPGWSLEFVGDGGSQHDSIEGQLRQIASAHALPRCTFHGAIADPAPMMAGASVFVFPSAAEGLPNSMLEALAHGLPVIADPELAAQWFGRPVPLLPWDGEADSLIAAMRSAALDPSGRHRIGTASREFVEKYHDPRAVALRLARVLRATERTGARPLPSPTGHGSRS